MINNLMTILEKSLKASTNVYSVKNKTDNSNSPFYDMLVIVKNNHSFISFVAIEPVSIAYKPTLSMQVQYICSGSIKSNLCSHMYFSGEDCMVEVETDSYYHICGDYSYTSMILLPCTLIEIAKKEFGKDFNCGDSVNNILKSFLEVFTKEYIIEEFDAKNFIIEPYIS